MSWEGLVEAERLQPHETSISEVLDLLKVADRSLKDAESDSISLDLRFTAAYNGALSLGTLALAASGYRTTGLAHHATTFLALPLAMGEEYRQLADYLDSCRRKRNIVEYRKVGEVTESELEQLLSKARQLRRDLLDWLFAEHPRLSPE